MNSVPAAERFLQVTSSLGVVDVRSIDFKCILVLTTSDTDDEHFDAIRVLARAVWPETPIMIGRRASVRETGTHRIVDVEGASERRDEWFEEETG